MCRPAEDNTYELCDSQKAVQHSVKTELHGRQNNGNNWFVM